MNQIQPASDLESQRFETLRYQQRFRPYFFTDFGAIQVRARLRSAISNRAIRLRFEIASIVILRFGHEGGFALPF